MNWVHDIFSESVRNIVSDHHSPLTEKHCPISIAFHSDCVYKSGKSTFEARNFTLEAPRMIAE